MAEIDEQAKSILLFNGLMVMVLFRLLCLLFVVELVGAGYLVSRRLSRPRPVLPDVELADPLLMNDLQTFANRAEAGGQEEWMELGQALLGEGFYSHAELCFRHVVDLDAGHRTARSYRAFCLERTGRTEQSTAEYEQLVAAAPSTQEDRLLYDKYQYAIGRNLLREEKAEQAEAVFRENRRFLPASYQWAKLLVRSDRAKQGLAVIDPVLERLPHALKFRHLQYRAFKELGREPEALAAADRLERSRPVVPANLGIDLVDQFHGRHGINRRVRDFNELIARGELDAMAAKLEELLTLVRGRHQMHQWVFETRLLEVERLRGRPERMLELIAESHRLGRSNAELLRYEAEARALMGDREQAAALWRRAVRMNPTIEVHEKLTDYYEQQQDGERASRHRARIALMQAETHYRDGELTAAHAAASRAVELNPRDPEAWFYHAEILRGLDQPREARHAYEQCLKHNPHHGRAIRALQRLTPDD